MVNNKNIEFNSMKRKLQVLDRFVGYCPVCDKKTPQTLAYIYKKQKMPIIMVIINVMRYSPSFYGIICNNCSTVLRSTRYSKEIMNKYGKSTFSFKHKQALEPSTRKMEIKFIKRR